MPTFANWSHTFASNIAAFPVKTEKELELRRAKVVVNLDGPSPSKEHLHNVPIQPTEKATKNLSQLTKTGGPGPSSLEANAASSNLNNNHVHGASKSHKANPGKRSFGDVDSDAETESESDFDSEIDGTWNRQLSIDKPGGRSV